MVNELDPPDLRTCIAHALQEELECEKEEGVRLDVDRAAGEVLDAIAVHELDKASLMSMLRQQSDELIESGCALQEYGDSNLEARARIMAGSAIGDVVQIMWTERRSRTILDQIQSIKDRVERILSEKVKEDEP